MTRRALPILVLAITAALPAPAHGPAYRSPVLPEITRHLDQGRERLQKQEPDLARAHAQVVLLGEEVRLGVKFLNVPVARREACLRALADAAREWERALDGRVHFVIAANGQPSSVAVRFMPHVSLKGEPVAGYVNWKRSIATLPNGTVNSRFTADMQVRVCDEDGGAMPEDAMRHTAMHELGHVLGLDDHPRTGNLMGPLDVSSPVHEPTAVEMLTVRGIRAEAEAIQRAADLAPRR